nr:hypothetical protein [uncultured Prevotella sp.]
MEDDKKLYDFGKLCAFLKIPKKPKKEYQEITHILTVEEQLHNIEFTEEGVFYTDSKGNKWLGYVYKKYKSLGNGGRADYPRMHLCHCGVTDTWGEEPYVFSNTIPIECFNTSDNNSIKVLDNIEMCKNCIPIRRNNGWRNYRDAKQYVKYIRANYDLKSSQEVNRWGFTKDWQEIREQYILSVEFRCERCGRLLDSVAGITYLHVYHIDRDFTNNDMANLKCLCTRCYCNSWGVEQTDALKKQLYGFEVYLGEKEWEEEWTPFSSLNNEQRKMIPQLVSLAVKEAHRLIKYEKYSLEDAICDALTEVYRKFEYRDWEYLRDYLPDARFTDNGQRMCLKEWYEYYHKPKYKEGNLF